MKRITKLVVLLVFFIAIGNVMESFAQNKNDYFVTYVDSTSGKSLIGFKDAKGKILLKAKYPDISYHPNEKLYHATTVLDLKEGFVFVNRYGKILFHAYIYDGGPDYTQEGLFRIRKNGKVGFANENYQIVIAPAFDFVSPFNKGLADYAIGGEPVYEDGKTRSQIIKVGGSTVDRHWTWGGAVTEVGYINKNGIRFKTITDLKNGNRKAITKKNERYLLDKRGKVIKKL